MLWLTKPGPAILVMWNLATGVLDVSIRAQYLDMELKF